MGEAEFRVGHQVPEFGGIDRDHDPAAIPVHRFRDAINVRLVGRVVSRGGQEKLNPNQQIVGCATGIFGSEYQFPPGTDSFGPLAPQIAGHLFTIPSGGTGTDGSSLGEVWQVNLPDVSRVALDPDALLNYTCCARLASGIIVGSVSTAVDDNNVPVVPNCTLRHLAPVAFATFPNAVTLLTSMAAIGTNLYIGALTATAARIYKWDGTSLTLDKEFAASGSFLTLAVYNNSELIASVHSTTELWRRSALGVWSQPALPVGVTNFRMNGSATLGLKVYLGGTGTGIGAPTSKGHILSWDGAAFALEREIMYLTPPYNSNTSYNVGALTALSTTLYYAYAGTPEGLWVGTYDGATWTDQASQITAPMREGDDAPLVGFTFAAFVALFWDSASILHATFITTDQDIAGAWVSFVSADAITFDADHWTLDYGPMNLAHDAPGITRTQQVPLAVG